MPSLDLSLFASTFALIFLAELPDKTAFAVLLMATRGRASAIFLGVAAAFLVQTVIAVCFGKLFTLLPEHVVHLASGVLFLGFAAVTWFRKEEAEDPAKNAAKVPSAFVRAALSSFMVIFIAEWGDLTQLASATLVAKYPAAVFTIFTSTVLALWSTTAVTIFIGHHAKKWINPAKLQKAAAIAFALVGGFILYRG